MQSATLIMQWIVRLAGITQIVTGLLFWTGRALTLVPLHMAVGLIIAITVLALSALAWRAGAPPGMVGAGILLAVLLPALGMTQTGLLIGRWHWVIRVVHLLIGLGALRLGEGFANQLRRTTAPTRTAATI